MARAKAAVTGFPLGIEISIGLHALVVLIIWGALHFHPGAMALPPVNNPFDHAIAVSLTPAPKPQPKPQTPPTPHVPKPQPPAVETQATQSQDVVPPPAVKPTPPQPPQTEQDQAQVNPDYAQMVEQILNENKRYPREAVLAGTEGEVVLYFVINNQGTVLAFHVDKSSGSDVLDHEVTRLIHSVRFPPFPPGDKSARKELTVPIEFKLGGGTSP